MKLLLIAATSVSLLGGYGCSTSNKDAVRTTVVELRVQKPDAGIDANEYRNQINDIQEKYKPQLEKLQKEIAASGGDTKKLVAALGGLSTLADKYSAEISKLKAPSNQQAAAKSLVSAESDIAAAAKEMKTAAQKGDISGVSQAGSKLEKASQQEATAISSLNSTK